MALYNTSGNQDRHRATATSPVRLSGETLGWRQRRPVPAEGQADCNPHDVGDGDGGVGSSRERKNGRQRQRDPNARQDIFADTCTGQAVGQRIENRVIDPVAGEIVTGVQRDIQDNKNPQHR